MLNLKCEEESFPGLNDEQPRTFEHIFEKQHPVVLRYAERRLPSLTLAEDITADVFHAAWDRWAVHASVELPWLYRVASNKICDHYRSHERRNALEVAMARLVTESEEDHSWIDSIALRDALLTLSERDHEAITLFYWKGISAPEIAETLGCTRTTVWAVLSRARKRLRGLLDV